ncbi:hypothetical protein GCM10027190_09430 [Spirosoma areae]
MKGRVILHLLLFGHYVCLSQSSTQNVRLATITVLNETGHPQTINPQPEIRLKARQNYLTFRFSASQPTPFRYKLDGLDNDWLDGVSTDQIHYANLPGGIYIFRVEGQEEDVRIELDMPIWKHWWFAPALLLYLIGVIGVVFYLFLQYRFRQKLRELQARDRIARDLHDDMGSYLSSISILSQTARRSATKDPAKTQATLDRIGQTARQIMDSMGDIVWSINPDHDSMTQVVARMNDVAAGLFAANADQTGSVALQMDVAEGVRQMSLSAENRRDFFLIYKEAITNVARYASADRVRVALSRESGRLVLIVQDNGRGFDPKNPARLNPSGGNGLRNMQTRAALLGGKLSIESAVGEGTTLSLRFPA